MNYKIARKKPLQGGNLICSGSIKNKKISHFYYNTISKKSQGGDFLER
jgi:hypothetical protein